MFKKKSLLPLNIYIRKSGVTIGFERDGEIEYYHSIDTLSAFEIPHALRVLLNKHNLNNRFFANIILSKSYYEIYSVPRLNNVPDEEISTSLPWLVKDQSPLPVEHMLCDYCDSVSKHSEPKLNITVVDKTFVQTIVDECIAMKIKPNEIITEEYALAKYKTPEKTYMFLTCNGEDDLLLAIIHEDHLVFSRRIQNAVQICDANELILDQKLEEITTEVQTTREHFSTQISDESLDHIVVAVNGPYNSRLQEHLMENIGVLILTPPQIKEPSADTAPVLASLMEETNA